MIRIIAVDDEQPALRRVGKLLEQFEHVRIAGLFDKPAVCLEYMLTVPEPVDLALLDMEMPFMHGLELARRLRACRPELHVAFLTAHEEFAREAFDVEAIDYLLKPVMMEDLDRAIGRLSRRLPIDETPALSLDPGIAVYCFGPFTLKARGGEEIRFRNSKSKELLAYLHDRHGKPVSKAQILEDLWYGRDVERTQVNLHSTVYQLRKDLEAGGIADPIVQSKLAGGTYSLSSFAAYDDVMAYEEEVRRFKHTSSLQHALKAVQLYGSGYFSGNGYMWATPRQAELELGYVELLEAIVNMYVRQQRYEIALSPLRKWAELDPLNARLHDKMTALLLLMNREADAKAYRELARELFDEADEGNHTLAYELIAADPLRYF